MSLKKILSCRNIDTDPGFNHNIDPYPSSDDNFDLGLCFSLSIDTDLGFNHNIDPDPCFHHDIDLDPSFDNNIYPDSSFYNPDLGL